MKTANELAQEYFAKTPMERLHTTLQDYVYDYQKAKIDQFKEFLLSEIRSCEKGLEMVKNDKGSILKILYTEKLHTLKQLHELLK